MNNQFSHMQKLAFGKPLSVNESALKDKIKELVQSIQTDALSTPHGKRVAIEELQKKVQILIAKDVLQKQFNKLVAEKLGVTDATA